jgi:hypothetical protein
MDPNFESCEELTETKTRLIADQEFTFAFFGPKLGQTLPVGLAQLFVW